MDYKLLELAHIRNLLLASRYGESEKILLNEVKQTILKLGTPFKDLALNAIANAEEDIQRGDFKDAAREIDFIHNFTFKDLLSWDIDYFYNIELSSYVEQVENFKRLKKVFYLLGSLQNAYGEFFESKFI